MNQMFDEGKFQVLMIYQRDTDIKPKNSKKKKLRTNANNKTR